MCWSLGFEGITKYCKHSSEKYPSKHFRSNQNQMLAEPGKTACFFFFFFFFINLFFQVPVLRYTLEINFYFYNNDFGYNYLQVIKEKYLLTFCLNVSPVYQEQCLKQTIAMFSPYSFSSVPLNFSCTLPLILLIRKKFFFFFFKQYLKGIKIGYFTVK